MKLLPSYHNVASTKFTKTTKYIVLRALGITTICAGLSYNVPAVFFFWYSLIWTTRLFKNLRACSVSILIQLLYLLKELEYSCFSHCPWRLLEILSYIFRQWKFMQKVISLLIQCFGNAKIIYNADNIKILDEK